MARPDTIALLLAEGSVPMNGTAQEVAQFLKSEQQHWGAVVREANIKLD
jgi:tripartite-type tricarboxylate transporter receptor subunit TctC